MREEVFKMTQKKYERLEDLMEIFAYNVKRENYTIHDLILKSLLLRAIRDKWINILNLMSKGDVS